MAEIPPALSLPQGTRPVPRVPVGNGGRAHHRRL